MRNNIIEIDLSTQLENIEGKNNMANFHPIILALLHKGEKIELLLRGSTIAYRTEGFYNSGELIFVETDAPGQLLCIQKYDENLMLTSIDDLVHLNYTCWHKTSSGNPSERWLAEFIRLDLVEPETRYRPKHFEASP